MRRLVLASMLLLALPLSLAAQTMQHYIPYVLHMPIKNADGTVATCLDGFGDLVSSNFQPLYDTLVGIANPTGQAGDVALRFFRQDGTPALWGGGADRYTYRLQAGRSVAMTLIHGNVFPQPPQDFVGYGIVETPLGFTVYAMLGGSGCYPQHWNHFSANVPVRTSLAALSTWVLPYAIPQFEDVQHLGPNSYRSGLVITNFDVTPVTFRITFTVGDFYPHAGSQYTFTTQQVGAGKSVSFDLYRSLLDLAGYPAPGDSRNNSEGWVRIEASAPVRAFPYLLLSNRDYSEFSSGEIPAF